jgi:NAD(P)-dependent dehydrogenase (short-subunit alcohol dehydrogenase family)
MGPLLAGRNAVVYGGGGAIGGAVARAFGREGARVFLAGRTEEPLVAVADDIRAAGGQADLAVLDALDEKAVDAHADALVAEAGSLDITLNVVSHGDVQGTPLVEMSVADFEAPVVTGLRTNFITTRAAARHMIRQRSGVILVFGGDGDPMKGFNLGGLQVGFTALECLRRQLASELGGYGIRAVTLRTAGIPESLPMGLEYAEAIEEDIVGRTMLGRAATLADVGNIAAFVASDLAAPITATAVNISAGTMID